MIRRTSTIYPSVSQGGIIHIASQHGSLLSQRCNFTFLVSHTLLSAAFKLVTLSTEWGYFKMERLAF